MGGKDFGNTVFGQIAKNGDCVLFGTSISRTGAEEMLKDEEKEFTVFCPVVVGAEDRELLLLVLQHLLRAGAADGGPEEHAVAVLRDLAEDGVAEVLATH